MTGLVLSLTTVAGNPSDVEVGEDVVELTDGVVGEDVAGLSDKVVCEMVVVWLED